MTRVLNITNGDSAVEIMQQAGITGDFLPWRDVLHDGPVPDGLDLDELSEVRAKFISGNGWGALEKIKASFVERDDLLKSLRNSDSSQYTKVILWFEHDLYDQLQIIQILDWFHLNINLNIKQTDNKSGSNTLDLSIICVDQYLGLLTPEEMADLYRFEVPVTEQHLTLSTQAWTAFRSTTPEKWCGLLDQDTQILPFLEGAIIRQLEEYPNYQTGLSRTAMQALKIISEGESNPRKVFVKSQEYEDRVFMGDLSFWVILQELLDSSTPLIKMADGLDWSLPPKPDYQLMLTPLGESILSGEKKSLELNEINRWIGGVHLSSKNSWCWNPETHSLIKRVSL